MRFPCWFFRRVVVVESRGKRAGGGSRCLRVDIVLSPTETQRRAYDDAAKSFGTTLAELRSLIDGELRDLQRDLDEAGVPWTSGRLPRWERTEEF